MFARASLYGQLDEAMVDEARALAVLVEQEGDELDTDLGPNTLAGGRTRYFQLWAEDGQVMARSATLGRHELARGELEAPGVVTAAVTLPGGADGRQVTLAFHPRMEPGEPAEPALAVLAVARGTEEVEDTLARLHTAIALAGTAGLLLCLGVLAWIGRFGLAPIGTVARRIAEIDPAAPAARLAVDDVPAELAPIVDRLDDLLGRLRAVVARERELTGEVAHELRTPIAGLRSTLELSLSREREPGHYRTAMTACLAIVGQTHRMVEALLALARLDAGSVTVAREPVALGPVIDDALAQATARAGDRGLRISRPDAELTATTDPDRIRVVIGNLVDNAVSHADAGGAIRIELAPGPGGAGARIRIANTGSAIGPDAARHVFERFWRGDASRAAGEHAGLGLALCKKLVDLLGGTIAVDAAVGGEFVVTMVLPG